MKGQTGRIRVNSKRLLKSAVGVFLVLLLSSLSARAQGSAQTITPPTLTPGSPAGSYALSDFDTVNLFNGNMNFRLPLLRIGGRGEAQFPLLLDLEARWRVIPVASCSPCGPAYYPTYNWWTDYAPGGYRPGLMSVRQATWGEQPPNSDGVVYPEKALVRFTFTAADGTEFELRDAATNGEPKPVTAPFQPPTATYFNRGSIFVTADGTSATFFSCTTGGTPVPVKDDLEGTQTLAGYLFLRDGTRYRIDNGLVQWMQDRNGNRINFYYESQDQFGHPDGRVTRIVDSLNRQVTIAYDVNDGAPYGLCDRITFQGFENATRYIRVSKSSLGSALRSGFSLHSTAYLFPALSGSSQTTFNPQVTTAVWLPNGKSYTFQYNDYGELARVVLPTGGAFEYDWDAGMHSSGTGGTLGASLIYRRLVEKRVYSNGGSTYESKATYSKPETYVQNGIPSNVGYVDVTKYGTGASHLTLSRHYFYGSTFINPNETSLIDYYPWKTGKEYKTEIIDANGSTVIQRTEHNLDQASPSWWPTSAGSDNAPSNNPKLTETSSTWVDTNQVANQVAKQSFSYDAYNNKTVVEEFDYGLNAPPTNPVRRTEIDYVTTSEVDNTDYTGGGITSNLKLPYLRSLPKERRVYWVNPSTAVKVLGAKTHFYYDQFYYEAESLYPLVDRPNITGHDPNYAYAATNKWRGNLTTTVNWTSASETITTFQQYDIAGRVVQSVDGGINSYLVDYANSSNTYAFPTSTKTPAPDPTGARGSNTRLETLYGYDFYTGLVKAITDPNGKVTTANYTDALDRLTSVIYPSGGGQVSYAYGDDPGNIYVQISRSQDASITLDSFMYFDGLGRSVKSAQSEGSGTIYAETQYDALGRVYQQSNPYRLGDTARWTTTEYDRLSRVKTVTLPGGAQIVSQYSGNTVMVTDPTSKARKSTTDALGRLTQVIEDPGSSPHLNYQTSYTYDALNNLRKVSQGTQTRHFMYDWLSRLIRAKNPEQDINSLLPAATDPVTQNSQWSASYSYDNNGNLTSRVDPRNITCNYTYDAINRILTRSYQNDTHQTPSVEYKYDGKGVADPLTAQNTLGHLTSVAATSSSPLTSTYTYDNFDAMGRVLHTTQTTDSNVYTMSYGYDHVGHLTSQTYPSGRVVTTSFDSAGRISDVASGATHYASSFTYGAHGGVTDMKLGNGLWEHTLFDPDRLQPTEIGLGSSKGASDKLKLNYSYGPITTNNGNLASQTITIPSGPTLTQSYTYDGVNRLKSAQEIKDSEQWPHWIQTFIYDQYGNRTIDMANTTAGYAGANPQISSTTTTNRIEPRTGEQYLYDLAGNLTKDASGHTFEYDAENLQVKYDATAVRYFYDGEGRRVKTINWSGTTICVYDAMGKLVAEYTSGSGTGSGTSYITSDHLRSPRIITGTNTASIVKTRHDYLPFGEEIIQWIGGRNGSQGYVTDNVRQKFTGKERDTESGLDYFASRYYASAMGRFTSADSVSGQAENPQTLNLFAYVINNPYKYTDPLGHSPVPVDYYDDQKQEEVKNPDKLPTPPLPVPIFTLDQILKVLPSLTEAVNDVIGVVEDNFYVGTTLDNVVQMYNALNTLLSERAGCDDQPYLVIVDADKYPEAAAHIDEAVEKDGQPRMVTLDRPRADARRKANMKRSGLPPLPTVDRDEYPAAMFEESVSASVRYVGVHDNRGAGSQMKYQLNVPKKIPDGAKVVVYTTKSFFSVKAP